MPVSSSLLASPSRVNHSISRYLITVAPCKPFSLPAHPGSMLRGALGHALLAKFCRCPQPDKHQPDCLYQLIFEGFRQQQQDGIPAFVITPIDTQQALRAKQPFRFALTLMGLPSSIHTALLETLKIALSRGLGPERVPCDLLSCHTSPINLTPLQQQVNLCLTTPWLIKHKGKVVSAKQARLHDFLIALAQRQRHINQSLGLDLVIPDNKTLLQLADQIEVSASLHDINWQRHSERQSNKHPLRGITGVLSIKHPSPSGLSPLSRLLSLGCVLHGGGKTAFGLGGLTLAPSTHSAPPLAF